MSTLALCKQMLALHVTRLLSLCVHVFSTHIFPRIVIDVRRARCVVFVASSHGENELQLKREKCYFLRI